jgi:hypothetical protein
LAATKSGHVLLPDYQVTLYYCHYSGVFDELTDELTCELACELTGQLAAELTGQLADELTGERDGQLSDKKNYSQVLAKAKTIGIRGANLIFNNNLGYYNAKEDAKLFDQLRLVRKGDRNFAQDGFLDVEL